MKKIVIAFLFFATTSSGHAACKAVDVLGKAYKGGTKVRLIQDLGGVKMNSVVSVVDVGLFHHMGDIPDLEKTILVKCGKNTVSLSACVAKYFILNEK